MTIFLFKENIGKLIEKKDSVQRGLVVLESGKKEKSYLLNDEESEKQNLEHICFSKSLQHLPFARKFTRGFFCFLL